MTMNRNLLITISAAASIASWQDAYARTAQVVGNGNFDSTIASANEVDFSATSGTTGTYTANSTSLTISGVVNGALAVGSVITGPGIPEGTTIVSQTSGTAGGNGVYVVSNKTTANAAGLFADQAATITGFSGTNGNSSTTLTIDSVSTGTLAVGTVITGAGIPAGTTIASQVSGTAGAAGVYTTNTAISTGTAGATFTAATTSGSKTVTISALTGTVAIGTVLNDPNLPVGTTITGQTSGTTGAAGKYTVSLAATTTATVAANTVTPATDTALQIQTSAATAGGQLIPAVGGVSGGVTATQAIQTTNWFTPVTTTNGGHPFDFIQNAGAGTSPNNFSDVTDTSTTENIWTPANGGAAVGTGGTGLKNGSSSTNVGSAAAWSWGAAQQAASPNGNFLVLDGDFSPGPIVQTLNTGVAAGLNIGESYTLTFQYAFADWFADNTTTVQEENLQVEIGGQIFQTGNYFNCAKCFSGWNTFTIVFTYTGTAPTALSYSGGAQTYTPSAQNQITFLASGNPSGANPSLILLAGVSLIAPEPAPTAVLAVGFLALVGIHLRQRFRRLRRVLA